MTNDPSAVEQAFADLRAVPQVQQELLRPVLIQAMQDPILVRQLASSALSEHLAVLGHLLTRLPGDGVGAPIPPLRTFVHLAVGEDVEDVEEAYDYVRTLDGDVRALVEGGLSRLLQHRSTHQNSGTVSLLALARLLAIAFSNVRFVAHVLDGREIEPFLPDDAADSKSRAATPPRPAAASGLGEFVGKMVEAISVVAGPKATAGGHLFVSIGRVVEISATHVVLETLRGTASGATHGRTVLLGMEHVVTIRPLT